MATEHRKRKKKKNKKKTGKQRQEVQLLQSKRKISCFGVLGRLLLAVAAAEEEEEGGRVRDFCTPVEDLAL